MKTKIDLKFEEEIYRKYYSLVYTTCKRFLVEKAFLDDAVQSVFLLYIKKEDSISANLSSWFYWASVNICKVVNKDSKKHLDKPTNIENGLEVDEGSNENKELFLELDKIIEKLPTKKKDMLLMRFYDKKSYREIGEYFKCKEDSVRMMIERTILFLKNELKRDQTLPTVALTQFFGRDSALAPLKSPDNFILQNSLLQQSFIQGVHRMYLISKLKMVALVFACFMIPTITLIATKESFNISPKLIADEPVAKTAPVVKTDKVLPELAPDDKIMAIINGLGDNSSAMLPNIKTVGEWNDNTKRYQMEKTGPVGRDFCMKMAWMPQRKRAFFCGVNHGQPHRFNDAWEYDLPSNTWVMLHPPEETWNDTLFELRDVEYKGSGGKTLTAKWLFTQNGGVPCGSHTWGGLTWDPNLNAAIWVPAQYATIGPKSYFEKKGISNSYPGWVSWAYYPYERVWKPMLSEGPWPKFNEGGQLEFIPDLDMSVWSLNNWSADGTWGYDGKANTWKKLHNVGPDVPKWALLCYDQATKTIVAQDENKSTFHFDITTLKWKKVLSPGIDSTEAPYGSDRCAAMFYDPINKVCLAYSYESKLHVKTTEEVIWSYSVADTKWTKHTPIGANKSTFSGRSTSYFDVERNVLVINASEKTWVYRYKKAK